MTYPQQASFTSGTPLSAWWFVAFGGIRNVCTSTGAAIVRRARQALGLPVSLAWDQRLVDALRVLRPGISNPADLMQTAIWVAYYRENNRPWTAISFGPSSVFPVIGASVANDGGVYGGRLVCFDQATDVPPELMSSADLQTAFSQSTTGLRLGPGRPEPQYDVTVTRPASAGLGAVGITAIAIVLVGGAWWWSRR